MSKKCCGIFYSDTDKVCKICGKALVEEENISEEKNEMNIDEITAMVDKIAQDVSGKATDEKRVEEKNIDEVAEEAVTESLDEANEAEEALNEVSDEPADKETTEVLADAADNAEAKEQKTENKKEKKSEKNNTEDIAIEDEEPVVITDKKTKKKDIPEGEKASKGLKAAGIIFLTLAISGLALVGLFVYFMVFNPYYDKNGKTYPLNYQYISSEGSTEMSDMLELMTATDASPSDATATDAKEGE